MFEVRCLNVQMGCGFLDQGLGVLEGKGWISVSDMIPNFLFVSVRHVRLLA